MRRTKAPRTRLHHVRPARCPSKSVCRRHRKLSSKKVARDANSGLTPHGPNAIIPKSLMHCSLMQEREWPLLVAGVTPRLSDAGISAGGVWRCDVMQLTLFPHTSARNEHRVNGVPSIEAWSVLPLRRDDLGAAQYVGSWPTSTNRCSAATFPLVGEQRAYVRESKGLAPAIYAKLSKKGVAQRAEGASR